ncbi:class I SAM-dependent methyltransferase [Mesorhizobium argentiipisi]|uniref:Methyltransferase n=1 Tax=Mesorhizobium argentiipisi TaxID=3015175 RepID=A0ABU8KER6_9HYPH
MQRLDQLRRHLDKETMIGIEIGPFFNPVAPKSEGWNTVVVDTQDGQALRAAARNHTEEVIRQRVGNIEDVDIVWSGQPLDVVALERNPGGYDFLVASHVIEHTPDMLSFLQQCSRLLKPEGIISLGVPDMRKCFDLLKAPTGIREILAAHRERRVRHVPETLFEARSRAAMRGNKGAWVSGDQSAIGLAHPFDHALQSYKEDLANSSTPGPYVDAHAWFFTPSLFQLVVMELHAMGLLSLKIAWLEENLGSEFIVQMRRAHPIEVMSPAELSAERIRLTLKHYAEFDREVGPSYRSVALPEKEVVEVPVTVIVEVPVKALPEPTLDLAKRLASRILRKVLSLLGVA